MNTIPVKFINFRADSRTNSIPEKIRRALKLNEFNNVFKKGEITALKVHFGEPGNTTFISPSYYQPIVEELFKIGVKPYFSDTNTLYLGQRANSVDHIKAANYHGFNLSTFNVPVIIADGLLGHDVVSVEVNLKHFKTVPVASAYYFSPAFMVVSHIKGHMAFGFGGAIKNVGMGMVGRAGKYRIHSSTKPILKKEACLACGLCIDICPQKALFLNPEKVIDVYGMRCVGCGACIPACTQHVFRFKWDKPTKEMHERLAEACFGVVKNKRALYINFLTDITPDCDCVSWSDAPLARNIGILLSQDPVAIDQASLDLLEKAVALHPSALKPSIQSNPLHHLRPNIDSQYLLDYAEKINLGTRKYVLEEII